MRITKRQLRRIIREVEGSTKKYDDDSALKGGQSKLPDSLQRGIIDKTVEDREEHEEEEKEKNESTRITKRQLRRIIKEEIQGYDPHEFMQKITDFDNEFQRMWVGAPFRSAGVRMAMEKMREALYELGTGMREELKALETLGD